MFPYLAYQDIAQITVISLSGMHQNQMYVQPSHALAEEVANTVEKLSSPANAAYNALAMPRIRWNPYIASGMILWRVRHISTIPVSRRLTNVGVKRSHVAP